MKAQVHNDGTLVLTKEPGDRLYRDQTLLYHAAKQLNTAGYDVIRKDAGKDGNLTSEGNFYVVDRKRRFCWHDGMYQIRRTVDEFNGDGRVVLDDLGLSERLPPHA